jgi:hypothetical protein
MMQPVPYEIREEDVDEVLGAYAPPEADAWPDDVRAEARRHVMRHVTELGAIIRTVAEDATAAPADRPPGSIGDRPGDRSPERREMALAAIEDLLIRDGFIEPVPGEERAFPVTMD